MNKDILVSEGGVDIYANITAELTKDDYDDEFGTVRETGYDWNLNYIFALIDGKEFVLEKLPKEVCDAIYYAAGKDLPTMKEIIDSYY